MVKLNVRQEEPKRVGLGTLREFRARIRSSPESRGSEISNQLDWKVSELEERSSLCVITASDI